MTDATRRLGRLGAVPLDMLVIDEEYQRELKPGHVRTIQQNWDPAQFLPIVVNRRSGENVYHVCDGHHRVTALTGLPDDVAADIKRNVPSVIHEGWTQQEESEYFWRLQRQRKNLTLPEEFKAQLLSRHPEAIAIQSIVRQQGYEVGLAGSRGDLDSIRAISALREIYRKNDADLLARVLRITKEAWPLDPLGHSYHLLLGLAAFVRNYRDTLDDDRVIQQLRPLFPSDVWKAARQATTANRLNTTRAMIPVLRDIYNRGLPPRSNARLQPLLRERRDP